jgi:hypothetical protein
MGTTLRKKYKCFDMDNVDAEEFLRDFQLSIKEIKDIHKRKNITENKLLLNTSLNKKEITLQYYDYDEQ